MTKKANSHVNRLTYDLKTKTEAIKTCEYLFQQRLSFHQQQLIKFNKIDKHKRLQYQIPVHLIHDEESITKIPIFKESKVIGYYWG